MKVFKIVSVVLFLSVLSACGSKTEKQDEVEVEVNTSRVDVNKLNLTNLLAEIKKREEAFKTEKTVNNRNAFLLMEAYVAFSERFNNRENADEYLFKAGELAMSQEFTVEAIRHLTRLYDEFPRYEKRAYGLFLLGFVQENYSGNLDEAKRIYELFLTEFPNHEMADDAKVSIENLGKSPEQIIREFEIKDSIANANKKAA
jgi:tetratricopeptide (TPR) repeat protein